MKYIKELNYCGFKDLGKETYFLDNKEAFVNFYDKNNCFLSSIYIYDFLKAFNGEVFIERVFELNEKSEKLYNEEFNIYVKTNNSYNKLHLLTIQASRIEIFS